MKSISQKRRQQISEYALLRDKFLWVVSKVYPGGFQPSKCQRCGNPATDVHHTRGRAGRLLLDTQYWVAVCRQCHEWIGSNPNEARKAGLLCSKGEWGKQ